MNRKLVSMALILAALAACSRHEPSAEEAASPAVTADAPVTPTSAAPTSPAATPPPAAVAAVIPAGMRGRFGMVPADCVTTRGDDKGLVTIGADNLKFYESIAKLVAASESTETRLKGRFAYSGEGMEWSREAALDLKDGGKTLVLEEFGEDAVPGPRTFRRCPA